MLLFQFGHNGNTVYKILIRFLKNRVPDLTMCPEFRQRYGPTMSQFRLSHIPNEYYIDYFFFILALAASTTVGSALRFCPTYKHKDM